MSNGTARRLAAAIARFTAILLPSSQRAWSRAMSAEVAALEDDAEALRFAVGCLWAAALQAAAHCVSGSDGEVRREHHHHHHHHHQTEAGPMEQLRQRDPRAIGLACAVGAVGIGAVYLTAAQAPWVYILVNAVALVLGLIAYTALSASSRGGARLSGAIVLALAVALVATALAGASADGVTRWVRVGSLSVQVSLLFLPIMIVAFARHRDALGTAGLVVAALALALQPDRAMAGVLAGGLLTLALLRFDARVGLALLAAAIGFVVTLVRPDAAPAVPWVDGILYSAFDVHPLIGAAVLAGALLLAVPAIYGLRKSSGQREVYAVFGIVWIGVIAAAALGNYPTPLVGYGGSAVLGYLLSLCAMTPARSAAEAPSGERRHDGPGAVQGMLRAA